MRIYTSIHMYEYLLLLLSYKVKFLLSTYSKIESCDLIIAFVVVTFLITVSY